MTISKKLIKKPRKARTCEDCRKPIEGSQWRLYGMAETGDPPYVIYLCNTCAEGG